MTTTSSIDTVASTGYTHTAFFYDGVDELISALVRFVRAGIDADEHVLVVVDRRKGALLVDQLGTAEGFDLADAADIYVSPTRTLANYIDTVRETTSDGRRMRVAGEPVWAGLDSVEVAEWTCVESACNLAFAGSALTMLCPYDISILDPAIIAATRETHPDLRHGDRSDPSANFVDPYQFHSSTRRSELRRPEGPFEECSVDSVADIAHARSLVEVFPDVHATSAERITDLASAVDEVVLLALESGAGSLTVGLWLEGSRLICDVAGRWTTPLLAAFFARPADHGSPGLWSAGQRCDLIAIREHDGVTTVRLQIPTDPTSVNPSCTEVAEFAGVYALGACDDDEIVMIQAHLAECPGCRTENDMLAAVVAELTAELATRSSPPDSGASATAPSA